MLKTALIYLANGIAVLPASAESKRPTLTKWKPYIDKFPTIEEANKWFKNGSDIAILCGIVSGKIEVIDADNHFNDAVENMKRFFELLDNPILRKKLVIEKTQSGGFHIIYRCEKIEGSQKLASRLNAEGKPDVVFETRGEGSIIIAAPSKGYKLIVGDFAHIPMVSIEEREELLTVARSFDEIEPSGILPPKDYSDNVFEDRPGDAFNRDGEIKDDLVNAGWQIVTNDGNKIAYRRPGKTRGISATWNYVPNKFYVFTSSTEFMPSRAYDKFAVYTILNHAGNFKESAKTLLELGYGKSSNTMVATKSKSNPSGKQDKRYKDFSIIESKLLENYNFRFNVITGRTQFKEDTSNKWEYVGDYLVNSIWREFQNDGTKVGIDSLRRIIESNFAPKFNPFEDYFSSLPAWDGKDRIIDFADIIRVEDEQRPFWLLALKKWFTATVATALCKGQNHNLIVMVGGQGVGKTRSVEQFFVPEKLSDYYKVGDMDPRDKDTKIAVSENFIINLDEFESASYENIGHLKSLITTKHVTVRRAYGHYEEKLLRRASFIASINSEMFLMDLTGTRRFIVVNVVSTDMDAKLDVDQLYSQALHNFNSGFKYWYDKNEIEEIDQRNERYRINITEDDLVARYLKVPSNWNDRRIKYLSSTEIINELENKTKMSIKAKPSLLGRVLSKHGFKKKAMKINDSTRYVWAVVWADETDNYAKELNEVPDDEPF